MAKRAKVYSGRKPSCKQATASQRPDTKDSLYGRRWKRAKTLFLNEHPLCVDCESRGKVIEATRVDHIIPHRGDKALFWDQGNWQSMCETCHNRKTAKGQ